MTITNRGNQVVRPALIRYCQHPRRVMSRIIVYRDKRTEMNIRVRLRGDRDVKEAISGEKKHIRRRR